MSLTAFSILESGDVSRSGAKPGFDANNPRDVAALRKAAMEFESMLLSQLTAAMNPSQDEEEESLFGGNTSSYYKQMFGEQMARQLAEKGGVGLADSIMQKLGVGAEPLNANRLTNASAAARTLRAGEMSAGAAPATRPRLVTETGTGKAPVNTPNETEIERAAATPMSAAEMRESSRLEMPLRGRVSSTFGARRDPLLGRMRTHQGVDIAARRGTPIAAAADGKVVFAGKRGGYGNLVEIEHADGRRTRYAHAEKIMVKVGDEVERGATVATVGSTGRSTGPHLHFEVKDNGKRVDPLRTVAKDSAPNRR